jgi:hypothetical protein
MAPPHKTVQAECQQKLDVSCCECGGQNVTVLAVMPYCGRCPNVGRLETGPKARTGPHLGP